MEKKKSISSEIFLFQLVHSLQMCLKCAFCFVTTGIRHDLQDLLGLLSDPPLTRPASVHFDSVDVSLKEEEKKKRNQINKKLENLNLIRILSARCRKVRMKPPMQD